MAWKSNELLGASQKLLDILRTPADAALLASGGLTVPKEDTAVDTKKTFYSTAEHDQEEATQRAKTWRRRNRPQGRRFTIRSPAPLMRRRARRAKSRRWANASSPSASSSTAEEHRAVWRAALAV